MTPGAQRQGLTARWRSLLFFEKGRAWERNINQ